MQLTSTALGRLLARASSGLLALALANAASGATYFQETFDSYADDAAVLAAGWIVNDNSPTSECDWTITNPGGRGLPIGAAGKFMVSDDDAGSPDDFDTNEELISPAINIASATTVWLHFATFSEPNDDGDTINNVDISTDGGATWTTVWSSASPRIGTATADDGLGNLIEGNAGGRSVPVHLQLTALTAGQATLKLRFHHLQATDDWFWIVDNIVVDDQPPASGSQVIMATESFEGDFPPPNWQVVRQSPNLENNNPWTRDDGGNCFRNALGLAGNSFINRLGPDHFAILDSDCNPDADPEDEQLWTPVLNCSGYAKVYLHLASEMRFNIGKTVADIDVSRDGGTTFTTLFSYDYRISTPPSLRDNECYYDTLILDASVAAGSSTVVFRFRNRGNGDEWFWGIDDVQVTGNPGTAVEVKPPATPTLTAPATVGFLSDLTLRTSDFSDPNAGDTHASTTWQVSRESTFAPGTGLANPVIELNSATSLTSLLVSLSQFAPGSTIYATAQHADQTGLKSAFAAPQTIAIEPLPTPIFIETFESTTDFTAPAGWTLWNRTAVEVDMDDPTNPDSNTYLDWVVVPQDTLENVIGGGRYDPAVVNGKSLFSESDQRSNAGQERYAVTPDYDLTAHNNIWLVFKSNYYQNQDNIGALEYSVDQGTTWLPIVYMIDRDDIVYTAGALDAVATMTLAHGDAPQVDDGAGGLRAGTWADFVAARPLDGLGPYISGRINDDARESRRIERFRLTQADNKNVRFRFAYAGTSSWWWGIDDFGLYSVLPPVVAPEIVTPPASQTVDAGANVSLTVSASGTAPLTYAWYKDGSATPIPGATSATLTFNPVATSDAGSYVVIVSNSAGSATSTAAVLTVNTPQPTTKYPVSQWDFNEGDLRATLGNPLAFRGDTAAGTTFETLPIGGQDAKVMKFPKTTPAQGFIVTPATLPNGGGQFLNQYTLIMDIMFPASSTGFRGLWQTDPNNANDGDLFVNGSNGIGISGQYQGQILPDTWHRVAFAFDLTTSTVHKYIDGQLVNSQTLSSGVDGRWSVGATALLLADEDDETATGYVNSIQLHGRTLSTAEIAALGGATAAGIPVPTLTGQWDFNQGDLSATIGLPLEYRGDTAAGTTFETMPIGGQDAKVMKFPKTTPAQGYVMTPSALPNGGGVNVNQYTVLMDIMFPATSTGFRCLWQTDPNNANDGDLFVNGSNGIGISGQYQGSVTPDAWHRVAFSFDLTKRELRKYVDGLNVLTGPVGSAPLGTEAAHYLSATSGIVDQRWSLGAAALLFADEDNETGLGYVNSIQFHGRVLSDAEIAALGGATAAGLPLTIPSPALNLGAITLSGTTVTISWTGGTGPFQLQKRTTLNDSWQDVGAPTSGNSATDTVSGNTSFYRVVGQ